MNERVADPFELHHRMLLEDIKKGLLVPVLGGEMNLCGRPRKDDGTPVGWRESEDEIKFPPSTCELAQYLLKEAINQNDACHYLPDFICRLLSEKLEQPQDVLSSIGLANVCQYIQFVNPDILDGLLPQILSEEYRPTPLHDFLVKLARYEPPANIPDNRPYPCFVTTCFDQVLEQQFRKNDIPFHLVAFVLGQSGGEFRYTPPGSMPEDDSRPIDPDLENRLMEDFKEHPVIIKLNGGVRAGQRNFAITEDHYIDYLTHQGVGNTLHNMLSAKLTARGTRENTHLLFMGYSLRNWNLRVILRRIWSESLNKNLPKRWTVVLEKACRDIEMKFWDDYGLKEKDIRLADSLEDYIVRLSGRLAGLPAKTTAGKEGAPAAEVARAAEKPVADRIFFSYSHKDEQFLERLKVMLAPVKEKLNTWDDHMIEPGSKWREEIQTALDSAKAAVLLVSPDFLASEFIQKNELPPLLEASKAKGCKILWIKVRECLVDATAIIDYQALYAGKALKSLSEDELDSALVQIARELVKTSLGF